MPLRDLVFISYSHRDKKWLGRLRTFLKPYLRAGQLRIWADPWIRVGDRWRREITAALENSHTAVLLVSAEFLASDFIYEEELPPLLEAATRDDLVLVCVPISASAYQTLPLEEYQWAHDPERPLDQLRPPQRNQALVEIARKIAEAAGEGETVEPQDGEQRMVFSRGKASLEVPAAVSRGQALGGLFGVPVLPANYVPRRIELDRLRRSLLSGVDRMIGVTGQDPASSTRRVGLQGAGGLGKTVMATALARDDEIRRAFVDGVFWVTVGQRPDLPRLQAQLAQDLMAEGSDSESFGVDSPDRIVNRLRGLLTEKACLLVLDDVWDADHAEAFDVLGEHSRLLITTRDAALLPLLNAKQEQLGVLSEELALALLARWSGQERDSLPAEAAAVAEACGYLPLALSMVAAQVKAMSR